MYIQSDLEHRTLITARVRVRVSLKVGLQRRDIKYHPLACPRQYASQESEGISTLICLRMYEKQVKKDH